MHQEPEFLDYFLDIKDHRITSVRNYFIANFVELFILIGEITN